MAEPVRGDYGDEVARLHSVLRAHGHEVIPDEVAAQFFGPSTAAAIADFQHAHGLMPTGTVTPVTADALATEQPATTSRAALDPTPPPPPVSPEAAVPPPVEPPPPVAPPPGPVIGRAHVSGSAMVAPPPGWAAVTPSEPVARVSGSAAPAPADAAEPEPASPATPAEQPTPEPVDDIQQPGAAVDEAIPVTPAEDAERPEPPAPPPTQVPPAVPPVGTGRGGTLPGAAAGTTYTVTGTVTATASVAVAGLAVELVDRNVGTATTMLTTGSTGPTGRYTLTADITPDYLKAHHKTAPDLQVTVLNNGAVAASSVVRYGASTTERLDVAVPPGRLPLASEYEALAAAVALAYPGSLADLEENDGRQDITYLANRTGWDARAIAMASRAAALAAGPTTTRASAAAGAADQAPAAPFYYALLRAGLPTDPDRLHAAAPQAVRAVWQQAVAQNVLPASLGGSVDGAVAAFQQVAAATALTAPPTTGVSTLGTLLTLRLGTDIARQQQFAALVVGTRDNPDALWAESTKLFGADLTAKLQLDGKLAYLTVNNAPLMAALDRRATVNAPVDLVSAGYHDASAWLELLTDIDAPPEFTAATPAQAKAAYAEAMAAQVRLAFPTATVGALVASHGLGVDATQQSAVAAFLDDNHDAFDIGAEPVGQYLARTGTHADQAVVDHVARLQRLYQITPNAAAMTALAAAGVDSAYAVTRWNSDRFVSTFADSMGGPDIAALTYQRSMTIHTTTLQVAIAYVTGKQAPTLGSTGAGSVIDTTGGLGGGVPQPATFAQATLEDLFGSIDYCACDDCRSITSAAAYLVDLLDYIDNPAPSAGHQNPLEALLARRPDIGALPLTCENTNIALPYIDLVNEILEYYVGNADSITGYPGHNTDGTVSSAELIAAPQNDTDAKADAAYTALAQGWFPPPLPFDRDLELLRAHVSALGSTLHEVLRVLRADDNLGPQATSTGTDYGWRDIAMERLGLSRPEYLVLTDATTVDVQDMYGYPPATDVAAEVSVLQEFSRRTAVSYDDIVAILQTATVNPGAHLIPLFQALDVTADTLAQVHSGALSPAAFAALLPAGLDPTRYGGIQLTDIATWVTANFDALMALIVIDVTGTPSDTTAMRLRHLDPTPADQPLTELDLYRLIRFVRLWRKLGLDIPATDLLCQSVLRPPPADVAHLDAGMATVLLRAGLAYRATDLLGLDPATDLQSVLTCWGPMGTAGPESLYAQLFLRRTVLGGDPAFVPDAEGNVLVTAAPTVAAAKDTLCAALILTSAEFDLLTGAGTAPPVPGLGLGFTGTDTLTVDIVSALYRHAWLARTLRVSILELLGLAHLTGIDPFAAPVLADGQPVSLPLLDFVALTQAMTAAGLAPVQVLYLLWNADLSGVSVPAPQTVTTLAAQLRSAFASVDAQFSVAANPSVATGQSLMALVLGPRAADAFFGLLGSAPVSIPFAYDQPVLPGPVLAAAAGRLAYDDLGKQLSWAGYLDPGTATTIETAAGADATLVTGVTDLAAASQAAADAFFATYDDTTLGLQALFTAYTSAADPAVKGSVPVLLDGLLPVLADRRKQVQALAVVSAAASVDPSYATGLLTDAGTVASATDPGQPAVGDLTAIGTGGLTIAFHLDDNLASTPPTTAPAGPLDFGAGHPLPAPTGGATSIAAQVTGYITATQDGTYGIQVRADAGSTVTVAVDGADVAMASGDGGRTWHNQHPVTLGAALPAPVTVTATGLVDTFQLRWESTGTGWQQVPAGNLYPQTAVGALRVTFVRFLKLTALATDLGLDAGDLAVLATKAGLAVGGGAWTARLTVDGLAAAGDDAALTAVLRGLLTYAGLKKTSGSADTRVRDAVTDLVTGAGTTRLTAVTGWDPASLSTLGQRFFGSPDLGTSATPLAALARVGEALAVAATCRLSVATLIAAATNAPTTDLVGAFQAAVRSRYAESDWLTTAQTINDTIRAAQRDALVAYVLLRSGADVLSALGIAATPNRLPTADDLFNYFLVDVEMEPCMLTSRIRHALSSVQLFIERCLRNLEPAVDPTDIRAEQWPWRKRYRVWQANREVFLWPENWMDETLRDDQSPLFKQVVGQLLQNDITDDTAASAYLDYLGGLDQVAKLEPCGLYVDPAADGTGSDTVHVIARSAGAHRKHYYRRYQGGAWTPWFDTKLTIEDHPVMPYVWNGRLLLLWTQVHRRTAIDLTNKASYLPQAVNGEQGLADTHLSDITDRIGSSAQQATNEQISVVLCFSEYYNGAWQPVRTSDVHAPVDFTVASTGTFDRSSVDLRVWRSTDADDLSLYVEVADRTVQHVAPLWSTSLTGFVVHNTHSAPVRINDLASGVRLVGPGKARMLPPEAGTGVGDLAATYTAREGGYGWISLYYQTEATVDVLTGRFPQDVRQAQSEIDNQWSMPFFMSDARSAFYVTTTANIRWYTGYGGYGVVDPGTRWNGTVPSIPSVVVNPPWKDPLGPVEITGQLGNPAYAQGALAEAAGMRAVLASSGTFTLNGTVIGATGAVATQLGTDQLSAGRLGTGQLGAAAPQEAQG